MSILTLRAFVGKSTLLLSYNWTIYYATITYFEFTTMKKASWKKWLPRLLAHTCPDIFESGTFLPDSKFPRPHVSIFKSNLPVHTCPTRIRMHSSTAAGLLWEYWQKSIRRKAGEICILLCLVSWFSILSLELWQNQNRNQRKMRRARFFY